MNNRLDSSLMGEETSPFLFICVLLRLYHVYFVEFKRTIKLDSPFLLFIRF
jgi:hypothetical protein